MEIRLAAELQPDSIVDGEGIRTVIWTQGCPHGCKGCHNPSTHDFDGGALVPVEEIIEELKQLKGQDGITLSGGDPFSQSKACADIAKYAKDLGLNIWCYTGYTFEEILKNKEHYKLLEQVDVLVDGKFELEFRSLDLQYKGSSNQRIIDVQKSLKEKRIILIEKYISKKDIKPLYSKEEYVFI